MIAYFLMYFFIFTIPQWILAYIIYKVICDNFRHVVFLNNCNNDVFLHLNGDIIFIKAGNKIEFICKKDILRVGVTSDEQEYLFSLIDLNNQCQYVDWGAPSIFINLSN